MSAPVFLALAAAAAVVTLVVLSLLHALDEATQDLAPSLMEVLGVIVDLERILGRAPGLAEIAQELTDRHHWWLAEYRLPVYVARLLERDLVSWPRRTSDAVKATRRGRRRIRFST